MSSNELLDLALPPLREHQQFIIDQVGADRDVPTVVQAVTGSGKTRAFLEIARVWRDMRRSVLILTHRKAIFEQLEDVMNSQRMHFGKIADGHIPNRGSMMQLAMAKTLAIEISKGRQHNFDLVIVDEAHVQVNGQTLRMLQGMVERGSYVVGFTATPIGVGHFYERLIVGCDSKEGRRSGAIIPAVCYNVQEPDRRFVKKVRVKDTDDAPTELSNGMEYLQQIVGRVFDHWLQVNPDRKPTVAFAPGVAESLWLAQQFEKKGVAACHMDGERTYFRGQTYSTDSVRGEYLDMIRDSEIELTSNRFVLREGVDAPNIYCCLLCTRFSAESAYLQAVGRVLRSHHTMHEVIICDHGGNFSEFGSPNAVRQWSLNDTNESRAYLRHQAKREDREPEMITCPRCSTPRYTGNACKSCGYIHSGLSRPIVQRDGTLIRVDHRQHAPRKKATGDVAKNMWIRSFYGAEKSGATYRKAMANFRYNMHQTHNQSVWPDPSWPGMPKHLIDHCSRVQDVRTDRIVDGHTLKRRKTRGGKRTGRKR